MKITRTANAGVLLTLDGVSVLLDGICGELPPYAPTPQQLIEQLYRDPPDVLAFTHAHDDHFDPVFAAAYQKKTLRPILGPESLPVSGVTARPVQVGSVKITPIPSRHIGKVGQGIEHLSFLIEGSRRLLLTGDASPLFWNVPGGVPMPKADVLLANYAYATTEAGWRRALDTGAETIVLLHLPERGNDALGLWEAVGKTTGMPENLRIPGVGETLMITI